MLLRLIWTRCTAPRLSGTVVRWFASARGHPGKQTTEFDIHKIRNIGIMAHIDAGKTTTTERMLFYSGITRHLGNVDDGDTVMDYMEQERDRGITITAAAITFFWKKHKINLIDTPGHIDFTLEVERALRVLDGAVAVLDASAGVEAQTLTVWRRADHYSIPRIIYMNKMDKTGADFDKSLHSVTEKLKIKPLVTQLPLGQQKEFTGIIDVIGLRKILWDAKSEGKNYIEVPLHPEKDGLFYSKAVTARTKLVEQLADINDTIAEFVLSDVDYGEIPDNTINDALRQATLQQTGVPVLCGSSLKNKGVQPLLDAITQYLPDPSHREYEFVEYYKDTMCALAFKITHDKQRGSLTFLRMYSGSLDAASSVYNVSRDCTEKVGRLLQVSADEYKELQTVTQGNIVAVSGLKQTVTGDTLVTNQKAARAAQKAKSRAVALTGKVFSTDTQAEDVSETSDDTDSVDSPILVGIEIPEPVFFCSVEPPSQAFQADMEHALGCLSREDPSLRVSYDEETGQNVLSGMGELHLDIIKDRLLKEYKLEVDLGPLQVSYREALTASTAHILNLDRLIGDRQHSVHISLSLCPSSQPPQKHINLQPDKDVDFSRLRRHVLKALDSGMRSGLSRGPILGFPVVNTEVNLHSLVVGRGTSTSFITAAVAQCIAEALQKGSVDLLEPVMNLEITTEESHVGTVIADLGRRRGMVSEVQAHQDSRIIVARTPLSEMIGYATTLRTITSGTASFIMELADYEILSAQEQQKAVQRVTGFIPL